MSMMETVERIKQKRAELAELTEKLAEQLVEGVIVQTLDTGRLGYIKAGEIVKINHCDTDGEFLCYSLDGPDYDYFTIDQILPATREEYRSQLIAEAERKVNEVFPAETEVGE